VIRTVLNFLSPAGPKARLSVLIFHRVLAQPDPLFPDEVHARRFDEICAWLKASFKVLPLHAAVDRLSSGTLPERACCITFDDGYADNATEATPVLQRHGLPATFFVSAGFLDGSCMWNDGLIESIRHARLDRLDLAALDASLPQESLPLGTLEQRRSTISSLLNRVKYLPMPQRLVLVARLAEVCRTELPRGMMMSPDQLRGMHGAGMSIGAHTMTHPILALLDDAAAQHEISESRRVLEGIIGTRVGLFAYPNGKPEQDYSLRSVELVREAGFDAAVSTAWGAASHDTDRFQLPRFTPWDQSRVRFAARMAQNLMRRETLPALLA